MSYIYITQKFTNGVSVGKIAVFFQLAFLRRELFFCVFFLAVLKPLGGTFGSVHMCGIPVCVGERLAGVWFIADPKYAVEAAKT